jgi:hypothetical protein
MAKMKTLIYNELPENIKLACVRILTDTINLKLKVPQAQSLLVKLAAGFSDPKAIGKTGS